MNSGYGAFALAAPASYAVDVAEVYVVEFEYVCYLFDSFLYVWGIVVLDHLSDIRGAILLGFGSKTFIGWIIHPIIAWIKQKSTQEK